MRKRFQELKQATVPRTDWGRCEQDCNNFKVRDASMAFIEQTNVQETQQWCTCLTPIIGIPMCRMEPMVKNKRFSFEITKFNTCFWEIHVKRNVDLFFSGRGKLKAKRSISETKRSNKFWFLDWNKIKGKYERVSSNEKIKPKCLWKNNKPKCLWKKSVTKKWHRNQTRAPR